ncbi:thymic stromal lymphopoietin isoform X1 [Macaca mulatta]
MSGTKSTDFNNTVSCSNRPHCLTEIQSLTFNPTPRCASLAKEMFARKTKATLALWCPGYSETQASISPPLSWASRFPLCFPPLRFRRNLRSFLPPQKSWRTMLGNMLETLANGTKVTPLM